MRKSLLLLILLSLWQVAAAQPFRILPPAGERGVTGESLPLPAVRIGFKVLRLSPGAVIYDQNNRTLTQGLLPAGADVFYTRDVQTGYVLRIYILTDEERSRLSAAPRPKVAPAGAPGMQR
jgi:hypothetical protein